LVAESAVLEIPLAGPAAGSRAEISGMAWCGEKLILLPQYPMMYADDKEQGYVFGIPNTDLDAFLSGGASEALRPEMIPFDTQGIERLIDGFEGFEAVLFYEAGFLMSIESRQDDGMMGYLVQGTSSGECGQLTLAQAEPVPIQPQAGLGNMSDETLVLYQEQVFTLYEANGVNVNPDPVAHRFDLSLKLLDTRPMPTIEYRITDATEADPSGEFWAINFFFPGDTKLKPGPDLIAEAYGLGESHHGQKQVERLIALRIEGDQISLAEKPPIYLALSGAVSRNWEGLVRYGEGFLLVTDRHPTTILAYVENIYQD
jgi:hypothetical protein